MSGVKSYRKEKSVKSAFTLVEATAALAIVSICLLALLRLHMTNIKLAQSARETAQALLLADEKIAQISSARFNPADIDSGTVEKDGIKFHWQSDIEKERLRIGGGDFVVEPSRVVVSVSWGRHGGVKRIKLLSFLYDGKI